MILTWLRWTSLLFATAVVVNPIIPGLNWGSRYLLTGLPLFALLAGAGLSSLGDTREGSKWPLRLGLAALLLAAALLSIRSVQAVTADLDYSAAVCRAVRPLPEGVIVTNRWWLGAELAADAQNRPLLLVETEADRGHLLSLLPRLDPPVLIHLGTPPAGEALAADLRRQSLYVPAEIRSEAGLEFRTFVRVR